MSVQLCLRITLPGFLGLEQSHAPKARLRCAQRAAGETSFLPAVTPKRDPCLQDTSWLHTGLTHISFNPQGISYMQDRCNCPTLQM